MGLSLLTLLFLLVVGYILLILGISSNFWSYAEHWAVRLLSIWTLLAWFKDNKWLALFQKAVTLLEDQFGLILSWLLLKPFQAMCETWPLFWAMLALLLRRDPLGLLNSHLGSWFAWRHKVEDNLGLTLARESWNPLSTKVKLDTKELLWGNVECEIGCSCTEGPNGPRKDSSCKEKELLDSRSLTTRSVIQCDTWSTLQSRIWQLSGLPHRGCWSLLGYNGTEIAFI